MTTFNPSNIDWGKINGLLPAIIQDNQTGQVLMLGYMNQEALRATCETGQVTFYSRTKKRLWMKGETSGNVLRVIQILADCDEDTILILAEIKGPCCHLNQPSCFGTYSAAFSALFHLEEVILPRYQERPGQHYTTQLFDQGLKRIAQKVGEEGVEVALAASCGDKSETLNEAADLLYHLLVLLVAKKISLNEVNLLLKQRQMS
jgi:phosphoribosyl-ATP pyrophosphohydrolase/phosphoribosyl-AMP cyclohydrolase